MMKRISLLTCLAVSGLALALGWLSYAAFERANVQIEQEQIEAIGRQFNIGLGSAGRMAMAQADVIAGVPGVIAGIADTDRQAVLMRILPNFELLKTQFGLDIMQAIDRNNVVIARADDPDRHGDDFSHSRPMIVQANVSRQPQNGLEVGTTGLRMRAVVPVLRENAPVGLFEVGQRLDRTLDLLRQNFDADVAVLLNPDAMRSLARSSADSRDHLGAMLADEATNPKLLTDLAKNIRFAQVKQPTFDRIRIGDHLYHIMQMPVLNYSGQPMGNFVAMKDLNESARVRQRVLLQIMSVAAIGAILICAFILVLFRGLVLGPVAAATAQAEALADGKPAPALPPRSGSDRVARLLAALEKLRRAAELSKGDTTKDKTS